MRTKQVFRRLSIFLAKLANCTVEGITDKLYNLLPQSVKYVSS